MSHLRECHQDIRCMRLGCACACHTPDATTPGHSDRAEAGSRQPAQAEGSVAPPAHTREYQRGRIAGLREAIDLAETLHTLRVFSDDDDGARGIVMVIKALDSKIAEAVLLAEAS